MKKTIFILILLIVFLTIQPVLAVEYYAQNESQIIEKINQQFKTGFINDWLPQVYLQYATYQAIKEQNRLIIEQTRAIWVSTCYAPHTNVLYGFNTWTSNITALQSECLRAGYPTIVKELL